MVMRLSLSGPSEPEKNRKDRCVGQEAIRGSLECLCTRRGACGFIGAGNEVNTIKPQISQSICLGGSSCRNLKYMSAYFGLRDPQDWQYEGIRTIEKN